MKATGSRLRSLWDHFLCPPNPLIASLNLKTIVPLTAARSTERAVRQNSCALHCIDIVRHAPVFDHLVVQIAIANAARGSPSRGCPTEPGLIRYRVPRSRRSAAKLAPGSGPQV